MDPERDPLCVFVKANVVSTNANFLWTPSVSGACCTKQSHDAAKSLPTSGDQSSRIK
jgi:hypothetical protein